MIVYCWVNQDARYHHTTDEQNTLCGKPVEKIPAVQPAVAPQVAQTCGKCLDIQYRGGATRPRMRVYRRTPPGLPTPDDTGHCPDCWGEVPLDVDGRVARHRPFVVGKAGPVQADTGGPCPGSDQKPDTTQVSA